MTEMTKRGGEAEGDWVGGGGRMNGHEGHEMGWRLEGGFGVGGREVGFCSKIIEFFFGKGRNFSKIIELSGGNLRFFSKIIRLLGFGDPLCAGRGRGVGSV